MKETSISAPDKSVIISNGRDAEIVREAVGSYLGNRLNMLITEFVAADSDLSNLARYQGAIGEIEKILKSLDMQITKARELGKEIRLKSVR